MRTSALLPLTLLATTLTAQEAPDAFADGLLALRMEDHRAAVNIFTGIIAQHPDQSRAWYYRGLGRDALGDRTGALHDLDRALLLHPGDLNVRLRRAEGLVHAERWTEAEADLRAILADMPEGPLAGHARYTLGQALVAKGDHAAARAVYDDLVRRAPSDAKAWCNRGLVENSLGEHEAAMADLSRAISLDPSLVKAYGGRAQALIAMGRKEEACPDIVKAREMGDGGLDELLTIYCL